MILKDTSLRDVGFGTAVDASGTNRPDGSGNTFDVVPINQLTKGREPGRVNLNLLWTDANASSPYSNNGHGCLRHAWKPFVEPTMLPPAMLQKTL